MRRIEGIVGNRHDDPDLEAAIAAHDRAGTLERVVLDATERKKSRLRVETDAGTDLGVLVDRPELREGDVLFLEDGRAAIVTFRSREAYVVDLPDPTPDAMAAAVELGHRVGNQHWDIAVEDGRVYVPLEADRHVLEGVVDDYLPEGVTTHYDEVDATLFVDDGDGRNWGRGQADGHDHETPAHDHNHE